MELIKVLIHQRQSLVLLLVKETKKFPSVYIMMLILVIYLLIEKKYLNKTDKFQIQFCLGSISNGVSATESRELSLYGNVYDSSVNYNFDILNIHNCLMSNIHLKKSLVVLNNSLLYYWVLGNL